MATCYPGLYGSSPGIIPLTDKGARSAHGLLNGLVACDGVVLSHIDPIQPTWHQGTQQQLQLGPLGWHFLQLIAQQKP